MNILLIAGHGDTDVGAVGLLNGKQITEADYTRQLLSLVETRFKKHVNTYVYPTERRSMEDYRNGVFSSISNIANMDLMLDFHFNAYNTTATGTEVYIPTTSNYTSLAGKIVNGIADVGFTNRGVKTYNYSLISTAQKYSIPAFLVETCFIDNPKDMACYTSYEETIADNITNAVLTHFDIDTTQEVDDMTQAEVIALLDAREVIYSTIDDVPDWGKDTVQKLVDKGVLQGDGTGLNIDETMLRILVINDRTGIYG